VPVVRGRGSDVPIYGDTMTQLIEAFRRDKGRPPVEYWDEQVSWWCRQHSEAMARENRLYHAADYYLGSWSEAVAMCGHGYNIIYDVLGTSPAHCDVLLRTKVMAQGWVCTETGIWLTVRGLW